MYLDAQQGGEAACCWLARAATGFLLQVYAPRPTRALGLFGGGGIRESVGRGHATVCRFPAEPFFPQSMSVSESAVSKVALPYVCASGIIPHACVICRQGISSFVLKLYGWLMHPARSLFNALTHWLSTSKKIIASPLIFLHSDCAFCLSHCR